MRYNKREALSLVFVLAFWVLWRKVKIIFGRILFFPKINVVTVQSMNFFPKITAQIGCLEEHLLRSVRLVPRAPRDHSRRARKQITQRRSWQKKN